MNNISGPRRVFFNDIASDLEADCWVNKLEPAYYLRAGPVITSENWRTVPITVVGTRQDMTIPPERQEMVWQGFPIIWLDAGHSPYVSQPEKVAEIIVSTLAA